MQIKVQTIYTTRRQEKEREERGGDREGGESSHTDAAHIENDDTRR